jgi:hypothetical protein
MCKCEEITQEQSYVTVGENEFEEKRRVIDKV